MDLSVEASIKKEKNPGGVCRSHWEAKMARTYMWREWPKRRLEMYLVMVKHVGHSKQ